MARPRGTNIHVWKMLTKTFFVHGWMCNKLFEKPRPLDQWRIYIDKFWMRSRLGPISFISRAVCSLSGNIFGVEISCGRRADDMRVRFRWRFGWQMTYVIRNIICMSSAGEYIIRTLSAGTYVIHTSSAELLMVSVDLNYLSTVTETGY